MDESVYHLHYEQETEHWWFAARSRIVRRIIEQYGNLKPGDTILDIGCGTGAILKELSEKYNVVGIDMSPLAVEYSKKRGLEHVYQMTAEEFPRDKFNVKAALLLDVIEHIDDDISVLNAAREIVGPEGRVIITVPAYPWMWSAHDVLHHHKRRYTAESLRAALAKAGLEPVKFTFYNTLLFPLAAAKKFMDRKKEASVSSTKLDKPSPLVNALFKAVFSSERSIVPNVDLPFGVSLLAVARPIAGQAGDDRAKAATGS
jgi:2-polyprenyl-3-methyl-5-hydroxy-6-metoxy-1,4-benzoquinol methylase